MTLTNGNISELLARRADEVDDDHRARAYRRASHAALVWPVEVSELLATGESATALYGVGTRLAARIERWVEAALPTPEPPPERSGFMTLTEARAVLSAEPSWTQELRADLQMHTTASDGRDSAEAMARECAARGYEHVAITDHTGGLRIPRGLGEPEFDRQAEEIAALNVRLAAEGAGLTVLHGAEVNLNSEGAGDASPELLAKLDLVLGSFHSALRKKDDQTARYLGALANPDIHVLAHPVGRKYNTRVGLQADWERVFTAATAAGKALEIDSYPDRQDLSVGLLTIARGHDVVFSIGTDAHNSAELSFIEFGLASAALARIPRERILNFWPRARLLEWAASLRGRR